MKIHHLNCGTMRPPLTKPVVCHVLLLETDNGLVLVDSGFGLAAAADPKRFGPGRFLIRPDFNPAEAAISQIQQLGLDPKDLQHIVLTHFDGDHTDGIADFPWATVHLTAAENQAALHPKSMLDKERYLPVQRAHNPKIQEHSPADGESWHGFASAKELTEIAAGIVLVNLPGHTRGHAAVAVETTNGWLLHAGDAFFDRRQINGVGSAPMPIRAMERSVAQNWTKVQANHQRLGEIIQDINSEIFLVNAHDPVLLDRAKAWSNNP